jgi:hypothetical protein
MEASEGVVDEKDEPLWYQCPSSSVCLEASTS